MISDYSALDIVAFYTDLGRDYEPLFRSMTETAKEHMPGCRTVLLSPKPPDNIAKLFDFPATIADCAATIENLCLQRGRVHVSWMATTERPALLVDPDIVFRSGAPIDRPCDVGLCWRNKPDQPINSGMVFARPGHSDFWRHYGSVVVNTPKKLWGWWCDQMGFSLMTGVCHKAGDTLLLDNARVALWEAIDNCGTAELVTEKAWAIHNKGRRKGPGWEDVFIDGGQFSPTSGVTRAGLVET